MHLKIKYLPYIVCITLFILYHFDTISIVDHALGFHSHAHSKATTTIVTAFFSFSKSKHNLSEYTEWMENLLSYTQNPIVIFTSGKTYSLINRLRYKRAYGYCYLFADCFQTLIITDFDTPWQIPPIRDIEDVLRSQVRIDPEKDIHSADLYAVWNAKPWMLAHIASRNPFKTLYFLWVDAGSFRDTTHRFPNWPNNERAAQIFEKGTPEKVLLGLINPIPRELCAIPNTNSMRYNVEQGPIVKELFQGTIFGGSFESVRWWSKLYYSTIHLYIRKKWFVGKDQNVMNALALGHPERVRVIVTFKLQCGDGWFAFGPLFADHRAMLAAFNGTCRLKNLSSLVVPLTQVCVDEHKFVSYPI